MVEGGAADHLREFDLRHRCPALFAACPADRKGRWRGGGSGISLANVNGSLCSLNMQMFGWGQERELWPPGVFHYYQDPRKMA